MEVALAYLRQAFLVSGGVDSGRFWPILSGPIRACGFGYHSVFNGGVFYM